MTAESKHTPGPWRYSFESVDAEWAIVQTKGGVIVSNVNADHRQEANARLIAAAPDLLAALERLSTFEAFTVHGWGDINPEVTARVEYARAAIAKARGK